LKILILGGGPEQIIAIEEAKKIGYETIVCDGNKNAPGLKLADIGLELNIRNRIRVLEVAKKFKVRGIFCHAVEIPEVVAFVSNSLNLPGLELTAAENATNKEKRLKILSENNIPVAHNYLIKNEKELYYYSNKLGFPLVIKPTDNAGSRGVSLVKNQKELSIAYKEAIKYGYSNKVLIEEVLIGEQISTESIIYEGKITHFAYADRNYEEAEYFYPFFIENGINFPSIGTTIQKSKVLNLVEKTIEALGINFGAAKGDVIIHKNQPYIIEMAARSSGGWFGAGSIPIATGVNPMNFLLKISMGDSPDYKVLRKTRELGCAQRYWIPREEMIIEKIEGLTKIKNMEGVKLFSHSFPKSGTKLRKATNHSERYAQVICTGASREEAIDRAERAIKSIKVITR
tara:strand:+ start:1184 stop:2386 length:1203 start_codon:yes stop_codon:yes gene_type:complete